MSDYLKYFNATAAYETYIESSDKLLPNISYCEDSGITYYNPNVPDIYTNVLTVKYNITSTEEPSVLYNYDGSGGGGEYGGSGGEYGGSGGDSSDSSSTGLPFDSMEIDGVKQSVLSNVYTFDTLGEHVVKYTSTVDSEGGTTLPSGLFNDDINITSVTIHDSITSIGDRAFYYCSKLTSVTIGNGVTSIGEQAFQGCYSITSLTIPASVTSIGSLAFDGCTGLTSINVNSGNTVYDSRNNCNAIIETETNTLVCGCKTTIIPDSVTSIGDYAFMGHSELTSITIPNSVTSIGGDAFYGCSGLTSVTIPSSVTSIGYNAFNSCNGLTSITIPNSVTSIGGSAFSECSKLTSVTIGNGVTSIGFNVFEDCSKLTNIICNATTAPTIKDNTFYGVKTGGKLTVPSGSTGYDVWMGTGNFYLGKYNWKKVEQ